VFDADDGWMLPPQGGAGGPRAIQRLFPQDRHPKLANAKTMMNTLRGLITGAKSEFENPKVTELIRAWHGVQRDDEGFKRSTIVLPSDDFFFELNQELEKPGVDPYTYVVLKFLRL